MVNIKNNKFGFSLAEALISMLVLSMFFIATSKIITTKPKIEVQSNRHGYFECYYDGGVLKQKRSDGSYAGVPVVVAEDTCSFVPPSGIAFVLIYALNTSQGRKFYHSHEPQFNSDNGNDTIRITADELRHFQDYIEVIDDGNPRTNELMNFFLSSYPSSSIYEQLDKSNNTYSGPAVFIGW